VKTAFPLFALLVAASICRAEEPASVTSRKMADCTVPDVIGVRLYESDRRVADLTPTTMPLLNKMQALVEKAHDPKRAVGEQLSGKDNEQFGEIRSRLMALQWHRLIEGRYSKHLELIEKMTESVDAKYRWGRDPDEKSSDYMAAVTPAILQDVSPINTFNAPKEDHCTLIWALHLQEQPSLAALNSPDLDTAAAAVKQLQQKYHVTHVDRNALSPDDQRIFDQAQTTLVRLRGEAAHAQQIEQIKSMVEASDMIYDASMKDFEQSAGDPDSSIDTLKKMEKDGKLSAQMVMRINVWIKLDEKYPSTEAAGLEALKKANSATPSK
jgi:regulator of RNase E activity RraB